MEEGDQGGSGDIIGDFGVLRRINYAKSELFIETQS
jgi:hypothetical protein